MQLRIPDKTKAGITYILTPDVLNENRKSAGKKLKIWLLTVVDDPEVSGQIKGDIMAWIAATEKADNFD